MSVSFLLFTLLIITASFALGTNYATAESTDIALDGEGTSKDGEHEGKSCPFKNKTASIELLPNI